MSPLTTRKSHSDLTRGNQVLRTCRHLHRLAINRLRQCRPPGLSPGTDHSQLLFCSGPASGTSIGSPECAGSTAARETARHGPAQASCGSDSRRGAIRTDLSGAVLPHHPAAGDDHRIGGGAAGRTDTGKNPCSIEIAATIAAPAAVSRRAARRFGLGLATSCRL